MDIGRDLVRKIRKNQSGFTLGELLITVSILVVLMAIAVPSVMHIQKKMRQEELDKKAETIYMAVQNKFSKMKAAGNTEIYQNRDGNNGVNATGITNQDQEDLPEREIIHPGDICYFTSLDREDPNTASHVMMNPETADEELLGQHWVVEYNPKSATVYGVFYSEEKAQCDKEYDDDHGEFYDMSMRNRDYRFSDGAKVGYYDGGMSAGGGTVKNMQPKVEITNAEKLLANFTCSMPEKASDYPVFKIDLDDNDGHVYTKYYGYWASSAEYRQRIRKEIKEADLDMEATSMQKEGRTFKLELTLDDLKEDATRFVAQYGAASNHAVKLTAGTPLTVKVTAMCPGNKMMTSTLSDEVITNSLFADPEDTSKGKNYKEEEKSKVILTYVRHLQNLDQASGVSEKILTAIQSSHLVLSDQEKQTGIKDWYETYTQGFYNGVLDSGEPNFLPIVNDHLMTFLGKTVNPLNPEQEFQYRIMDLTQEVEAEKDATAGLFATIHDGELLQNIVLTGSHVFAKGKDSVAGALVGRSHGNTMIENCQIFLTDTDLSEKDYQDVWISAQTAGGLLGLVQDGKLTVKNSGASSVVGSCRYEKTEDDTKEESVKSFDTEWAGGLVGSISKDARTQLTDSYADCYLVGRTAAGLVGMNQNMQNAALQIAHCYAAGYVTFDKEEGYYGAGIAGGKADLSNSYTVISRLHTQEAVYYSTAVSGKVEGNVYYSIHGSQKENDLTDTKDLMDPETQKKMTVKEMTEQLNKETGKESHFKTDSSKSRAYNLMGQSLSTYIYPVLITVEHYGDWDAAFQEGALVYYEAYGDGSYGFFGANTESTLKDDADLTVVGDGYGIAYQKDGVNLPDYVEVTLYDGEKEVTTGTISLTKTRGYSVNGKEGKIYQIYPVPKEMANVAYASQNYYLKAKLLPSTGTNPNYYYLNPHFAKSVLQISEDSTETPLLSEDSSISLRTARHLYMMSQYYYTYADSTSKATFLQDRNIDYAKYAWKDYSCRNDLNQDEIAICQQPIGYHDNYEETLKSTSFKAVYNGQNNWISNVSFQTASGNEIGLFGRNDGELRNIVIKADYHKDGRDNYNISRTGDLQNNQAIHMGVLAGSNGKDAMIMNCAVSGYDVSGEEATIHAYRNSYLYAGGLVGSNEGIISSCSADLPEMRLSATFADANLGGFVGNNKGNISASYALGHLEVAYSRGGHVNMAGFAGRNTGKIQNSYCACALTAAGESTQAYGFAPMGGLVSGCRYLNNGTYAYIDQMYLFHFDESKTAGKPVSFYDLMTEGEKTRPAVNSYKFTSDESTENYPFPAEVKNKKGQYIQYGNWLYDADMGSVGIFYWEHEQHGQNNGYHFTFLGFDGSKGTTLCTAHDDGGIITEYGYGYYESNQGSVQKLTLEGASINGHNTWQSGDAYNETVSQELTKQFGIIKKGDVEKAYQFYAFTTPNSLVDNQYLIPGSLLLTSQNTAYSSWSLECIHTDNSMETLQAKVAPYFANAMGFAGAKTIQSRDGRETVFAENSGSAKHPYEIRSVEQLQFINWNTVTKNCHTQMKDSDSERSRAYSKVNARDYTYLAFGGYNKENGSVKANWLQTHDCNARMQAGSGGFTPIGCMYDNNNPLLSFIPRLYVSYFDGLYDGQSYVIKNIDIAQDAQSVGLFSMVRAANLRSIILHSDSGNAIRSLNSKNWYCLGGLAGIAVGNAKVENCAVSGYTIRDESKEQGYGGANVGGLIGLCTIHLSNCAVISDIELAFSYNKSGNIHAGGLVGVAQESAIENCYCGGSIENKAGNKNTDIHIAGIQGGIFIKAAGNMENCFGDKLSQINGSETVKNSYSFMKLPKKDNSIENLEPIATLAEAPRSVLWIPLFNINVNNAYYMKENVPDQTFTDNNVNDGTAYTYAQMSENAFCGKLSPAFSPVTTREGSAKVDGKYSYPSSPSLEGKNYPFPTVITQNDLTFGKAVHVHYGDWPINGVFWEEGRASMDIFQDMQEEGTYKNYAVKAFILNPNGKQISPPAPEQFTVDTDLVKVVDVQEQDGKYIVWLQGLNTGTVSVSYNPSDTKVAGASFDLEVTANLTAKADPEKLLLREGKAEKVTLYASSVPEEGQKAKSFETREEAAWSLRADAENLVELKESTKQNQWTAKRLGNGTMTLTAEFDYNYHDVHFKAKTFIDVIQPDSVGLSDGKSYNAAFFDEEKTVIQGQDTSYSQNKPDKEGCDFFLYLDSAKETFMQEPKMTVQEIKVDGNLAQWDEETHSYITEGEKQYYVTLADDSSQDDNYEYLSGKIYCQIAKGSVDTQKQVVLEITLQDGASSYVLAMTLSEVKTMKEVSVCYENSLGESTWKWETTVTSGEESLLSLEEAQEHGLQVPHGRVLQGWKVKTDGEDSKVYMPGDLYTFMEDSVTFLAQWGYETATLQAGKGSFTEEVASLAEEANGDYLQVTANEEGKISLADYQTWVERKGYLLAGWMDEEGQSYELEDLVAVENLPGHYSLTAQWEAKTYKLPLMDVEATEAAEQAIEVTYGSTQVNLDSYQEPVREHYHISGWMTEDGLLLLEKMEDGSLCLIPSQKGYTDKKGRWLRDETVTLQAQWELDDYKVTFQDGSGHVINTLLMKANTPAEELLTQPIPQKTGYRFDGWWTEENQGEQVIAMDEAEHCHFVADVDAYTDGQANWIRIEDSILYAHWSPYTLSLENNGKMLAGDLLLPGDGSMTVLPKELYQMPAEEKGWQLEGWYKSQDGNEKILDAQGQVVITHSPGIVEDGKLSFTKDVTLYAKWIRETVVYEKTDHLTKEEAYLIVGQEGQDHAVLACEGKELHAYSISVDHDVIAGNQITKEFLWTGHGDNHTFTLMNQEEDRYLMLDLILAQLDVSENPFLWQVHQGILYHEEMGQEGLDDYYPAYSKNYGFYFTGANTGTVSYYKETMKVEETFGSLTKEKEYSEEALILQDTEEVFIPEENIPLEESWPAYIPEEEEQDDLFIMENQTGDAIISQDEEVIVP